MFDNAPETLQYLMGIHPIQIAQNQALVQAAQGNPQAVKDDNGNQEPSSQPRPIIATPSSGPEPPPIRPTSNGMEGTSEQSATDSSAERAARNGRQHYVRDSSGLMVPAVKPDDTSGASLSSQPSRIATPSAEMRLPELAGVERSQNIVDAAQGNPEAVKGETPDLNTVKASPIATSDLNVTPIRPISAGQQRVEQDQARESTDQAELDRLNRTGSGVDQFAHRHRFLGPLVKGLTVAGEAISPGVAALVPGTDVHHNVLVNQARGRVGEDQSDTAAHQKVEDNVALDEARRENARSQDELRHIRAIGAGEKFIAGSEKEDPNSPTGWSAQNFNGEWKPYTPTQNHKNTKADDFEQVQNERRKEATRLNLKGRDLELYLANGKLPDPGMHIHVPSAEKEHYDDVRAAFVKQYGHAPQSAEDFDIFNRMRTGERGGAGNQHTFKDSAAIDKYSNDWYARQRKAVLDEKNKAKSLSPDADDAALEKEYGRIEGDYRDRASDFENQKKRWYSQVNGGHPVTVQENENGVPQANASSSESGTHSGSRKSGDDAGVAPHGSSEGRTGKLQDGTPVIVKNGRLVVR